MRRIITSLLLSIFVIAGSSTALADKHNGNHGHNGNHKYDYGYSSHYQKDREKEYKKARKQEEKYWKAQQKADKRYYKDRDRELRKMVAYAARGGRDVSVWQISPDTYIVKYYRGGRYYTQRLYPYSGRYGSPGLININWSPESAWTLLPSININIPLR